MTQHLCSVFRPLHDLAHKNAKRSPLTAQMGCFGWNLSVRNKQGSPGLPLTDSKTNLLIAVADSEWWSAEPSALITSGNWNTCCVILWCIHGNSKAPGTPTGYGAGLGQICCLGRHWQPQGWCMVKSETKQHFPSLHLFNWHAYTQACVDPLIILVNWMNERANE